MNSRTNFAIAIALLTLGCAYSPKYEFPPYQCQHPAPSSSELTSFAVSVVSMEKDSLHYDLPNTGVDYDALIVRFDRPEAWQGLQLRVFYQGDPVLEQKRVEIGSVIEFAATPPSCLNQPWLFLTELELVK